MGTGRVQALARRSQIRQLDRGRQLRQHQLPDARQTQASLCSPELLHTGRHALHHHPLQLLHAVRTRNANRHQYCSFIFSF